MRNQEDYLNKIEDFSKVTLPNIDINQKDKEKIKENIMKLIKKLQEKNLDEFKININEDDIEAIKNNLGEDSDKRVYGVKDSKVMKEIIEQTIANELKGENIIQSIEYELPSIIYWGRSAIFNYAYVTDKEFIWYSFTIDYQLVSKGREKLEKIKSVGRVREDDGEGDDNGIEFWIRGGEAYFILVIHGAKKVREMDKFLEFFTNRGVKLFDKKQFAMREKIFYLITWGMVAVGLFLIFRQLLRI
ncbi:MAG: hypothetical protein ACRC6T_07660 [Sarcina sp.]